MVHGCVDARGQLSAVYVGVEQECEIWLRVSMAEGRMGVNDG